MSFASRVATLADTLSIPRELGAGFILKAALESMGLQSKPGMNMPDVLALVEEAVFGCSSTASPPPSCWMTVLWQTLPRMRWS